MILLVGATIAEAQQTGKIFRIGFLDPSNASGSAVRVEAFRQELSKLGWIEGKNIAFEYRFAEQKPERVPELAAELVRLKVDLIVTSGNPSALEAKKATTTIPIVMTSIADPVALGLVASLARPGGNVTGLYDFSDRAKYQKAGDTQGRSPQARPSWTSGRSVSPTREKNYNSKELRVAAPALKVKLEEIETELDAQGLESAFQNRKAETGGRDHDDLPSRLFRRKKTDRRACRQIPVAGYLQPEGVRR